MFKFPFEKRKRLAHGLQVFFVFVSMQSHAFLSDILEAKKKIEGTIQGIGSFTEVLNELGEIAGIEKEYDFYEKELREFQQTLDEYESLGLDVRDFIEFKNHDTSSLRGQIDFFKNYIKRTKDILKNVLNLIQSPESISANEQMETNRTLRALLEDNQTRELRRLRREIAKEKILLERRKKELEFINNQYAYINRHSKTKWFLVCFTLFKIQRKRNPVKREKSF